jgi:protein-disulfide isomerase
VILASRRAALGGALAFFALAANAAPAKLEPDDMALGAPKAPLTVIEYASVGCPHCAAWNNEVFPAFKAKYVDTGQVRFVVRECLTGDADLAAAGFLVARCAGKAKYFQVIDAIYRQQASMYQPGAKPTEILRAIANGAGLTDAQYNACLDDQKGLQALNARSERHAEQDKVSSTPTFDVGGQLLDGYQSLAQLDAAIAAARHKT